jgi:hypothetical protein
MKHIKDYNDFLNESSTLPGFLTQTLYRELTDEEIKDLKNYSISGHDLTNALQYVIVGKGILDDNNKKLILKTYKKIVHTYPDNGTFSAGYEHAKSKFGNKPPINIDKLKRYAEAIGVICNGEYGNVYYNEKEQHVFVILGDSNSFDEEDLMWNMRDAIKETHWVKDEEIKVTIENESGPYNSPDWKKIN